MQRGNIYLSVAEEEMVSQLQSMFNITIIEAVEKVIEQKRELAYIWRQRGNLELSRQISKEIDEWTEENESQYQSIQKQEKLIIL